MENNKCTPIQFMAGMIAELAQRATDAERQRDAEKKRADEWYNSWLRQGEELAQANAKLEKLEKYIKEHD